MQIEAVEVGVQGAGRADLSGVAVAPEALHRRSGTRSRGDPTDDGGALDLGVHGAVEEPPVGRLCLAARVLQVNAVPRYQPHDPPAHRCQQARHIEIGWRRQRHQAPRTLSILDEYTLRGQRVEVHVGIQRRPETPDGPCRTYGHQVEVFEAQEKAGGMLRYGMLEKEIDQIRVLGVQIHATTKVDSIEAFRKNYDAVFLGLGTQKARLLPVEGAHHELRAWWY